MFFSWGFPFKEKLHVKREVIGEHGGSKSDTLEILGMGWVDLVLLSSAVLTDCEEECGIGLIWNLRTELER